MSYRTTNTVQYTDQAMQDAWNYALGNYGAYNVWSGLKVYFYTDSNLGLNANKLLSDITKSSIFTTAINLDALSGPLVNANGSYGAGQDISATASTVATAEDLYGAIVQQNDGTNDYLFVIIPFMDSSGNATPVSVTQAGDFVDLQLQLPFPSQTSIS